MGEQRFTIQKASGMYLHLPIFDNDVEMADGDVCILLNEQQDKIIELEKNFDDLVKWASEISKRNVILDEQIGKLERENKKLKEENASLKQRIRDIKYNNCEK